MFRILRRNGVERKTTKTLEIAKAEPESKGDELFGSNGEIFD